MGVGRKQPRGWRPVVGAAALVALSAVPARARAADDEVGKPWLPLVEVGASPVAVYDSHALAVVHDGEAGWRINRGTYREGVTRRDFFVTIGRADLASSEQHGQSLRSLLIWGGAGVAFAGGVLVYASLSRGGFDPPRLLGFGTMGVGAVVILVGSMIHGPVVTSDEADAMVARYNARLKAHIENETGTAGPQPIQARLQMIAPFVDGRSGFGLLAVARF